MVSNKRAANLIVFQTKVLPTRLIWYNITVNRKMCNLGFLLREQALLSEDLLSNLKEQAGSIK